MKTRTAVLLCCLFCIATARAQSLRYAVALPYIGLSAYSKQQSDPFSFSRNQAALAQAQHIGLGVYGERRFLLAETGYYAFAAVFPSNLGNFGLQLNYAGFKNFNENKIGLAYARKLGTKLDLGIQFNYYGYRVPAYNSASAINFEAGIIMHFTDKFQGGMQVYNPVGGKPPSVYTIGMGYDVSTDFFAGAEVIKEEDKPVNCIAGVQYQFARKFFARLGISSETSSVFGGAGLSWNDLRVDLSASYHPQLGFSPGILLIMHARGKVK